MEDRLEIQPWLNSRKLQVKGSCEKLLSLMGICHRASFGAAALLASFWVYAHPVHASSSSMEACPEARVDAIGLACADLLRHEARFQFAGETAESARRDGRARARFRGAWTEAELAGGAACERPGLEPDVALALLEDRMWELLGAVQRPVCRRRLARILAPSCRARVGLEGGRAARRPGSAMRRRARLDQRLDTAWQRTGCGDLSAAEVRSGARSIAGFALGLATEDSLAGLADEVGLRLGVSIEPGEVASDPVYEGIVTRDTNSLTAENVMKWSVIHPQLDTWNYAGADEVAERAAREGKGLRGHTLVWGGTRLPDWVESAGDRESLLALMEAHITTVVSRYAGQVEQWDVVNEPLPSVVDPPTADGLDDNVFRRTVGAGYIAAAFRFAHAADPSARLFLNENAILLPGARQDRFVALVEELLAEGVPLHGIGIQGHIGLTPPSAYPGQHEIAASLRRLADLGLDIEITELDVVTLFMPNSPGAPGKPIRQALVYGDVLEACLAQPRCTGVTTWGLGDHLSWIRSFFGFPDDPLLFDDSWSRKPAWFAVRAELAAAAVQRR